MQRRRVFYLCLFVVMLSLVFLQRLSFRLRLTRESDQSILQRRLCADCNGNGDNTGTKIPKIIHQIWNDDVVPSEFVENVKSFVKYNTYPEWEYYFWTFSLGREFIKRNFPKVLKLYDCSNSAMKPDILRVLVVYHYGGAYFDLDFINVRPLDRFVNKHQCVLGGPMPEHFVAYNWSRPLINNALFLCRPHHPFLRHFIQRFETRSERAGSDNDSTCPEPEQVSVMVAYLEDNGLKGSLPEIVDYSFFEPLYDLTLTNRVRRVCSGASYKRLEPKRQRVCDNWRRYGEDNRLTFENSYTVHTWYHTGMRGVTIDKKNKISNIVPHVKIYNALLEDHYRAV